MLERTDELAKRWAIALILARPLEAIGEVPLAELAREAPLLCTHVLKAIRSDVELERLTAGQADLDESSPPARRIAAISGANNAREAAVAVEALRGVLWEALLDELDRAPFDQLPARLLAAVCDRLAYVCAASLAAVVDGGIGSAARPPEAGVARPLVVPECSASASSAGHQAVIVDELAGVSGLDRRSSAGGLAPEPASAVLGDRPRPVEIAIRDQRGGGGPAAWIGSIGAQLERFARDGRPFAVLLVELADIERLQHDELAGELSRLAAEFELALAAAAGRASVVLTRERPGRCWLLAFDTDRSGAGHLAERLASAVASAVSHRGAPLQVVVGAAVCPEDGRESAALAAHADVGVYAARSAVRASAARPSAAVDEQS